MSAPETWERDFNVHTHTPGEEAVCLAWMLDALTAFLPGCFIRPGSEDAVSRGVDKSCSSVHHSRGL